MSDYVRWTMQDFGVPKSEPSTEIVETIDYEAQRQALEESLAKGYEEGLEKGYREGLAKGYAEGHQQGLTMGQKEGKETSARLVEIAKNFRQQLQQVEEQMAHDILDLAMDIAKAMLKTALPIKQELLSSLVSEIIHEAYGERSSARLYLNPADVDWIRQELAEPLADLDWQIVAHADIEQGGCLIETAATQIDASLPTRWRRVALTLGRDSEWLAP